MQPWRRGANRFQSLMPECLRRIQAKKGKMGFSAISAISAVNMY
jgi:hypothetical protein